MGEHLVKRLEYSFLPVSPLSTLYSTQHRGNADVYGRPGHTAQVSTEHARRRQGASGERGQGQEGRPGHKAKKSQQSKTARPTTSSKSQRHHFTSMLAPRGREKPQFSLTC